MERSPGLPVEARLCLSWHFDGPHRVGPRCAVLWPGWPPGPGSPGARSHIDMFIASHHCVPRLRGSSLI
eukprot:2401518-Alexandrium_andersonii.AAC.1